MAVDDLDGLQASLFDSGWELQYWMIAFEQSIARVFGLDFGLVNWTLIAIAFAVLGMAIGYCTVQRLLNPGVGPYDGYNDMLDLLSPGAVQLVVRRAFDFSSFLLIPVVGVVATVLLAGALGSWAGASDAAPGDRAIDLHRRNGMALLLVAGAVFPYVRSASQRRC